MSNFDNVQVGDMVLAPKRVGVGFNGYRTFYVPAKVIRVSKTQFTVEGHTFNFYKKNGCKVEKYSNAQCFHEGDRKHGKPIVTDQTAELELFEKKMNLRANTLGIIESIYKNKNIDLDLDLDVLESIHSAAVNLREELK